jgi:2-C-methyl-D-erythritol 2,4-cyclodiphosphate synthase
MKVKTAIGQDSHRFAPDSSHKPLILAGLEFPNEPGLEGNSDADVVLHAIINAISGITGVNILGAIADELCLQQGITDSKIYLQHALAQLANWQICHISCSIECKRPHLSDKIPHMKQSICQLLGLNLADVGITATSGEALSDFGRGHGIQVLCIITAVEA